MKVEWRYTETGQKVRISLRSGRVIPLPIEMHETIDYKEKHLYIGKCVYKLFLSGDDYRQRGVKGWR